MAQPPGQGQAPAPAQAPAHGPLVFEEDGLSIKRRLNIKYSFIGQKAFLFGGYEFQGLYLLNNNNTWFINQHARIKIYMCSIFYLGRVWVENQFLEFGQNADYRSYWESGARRQVGTHLFMNRWGKINMVTTSIFPQTTINNPQVYPFRYTSYQASSMNAIYPVARIVCLPHNQQIDATQNRLTLGLVYRDWPQFILEDNQIVYNYDGYFQGDRQYARQNSFRFPTDWGRVSDLIVENVHHLNDIRNELNPDNRPRVAFYVCAGAKLVLLDDYNDQINLDQHNRSIVQQGGVVIIEGCRLQFAVGLFSYRPGVNKPEQLYYTLEETWIEQILVGARNPSAIRNPVIFLGPTESEYESIAWKLVINRDDDFLGYRTCCLNIPDNGHIVAIEEWNDGFDEIIARYQYERLHRSTVGWVTTPIFPDPNLVVPAQPMLERILGVGQNQNRHYECNIRVGHEDIFNQLGPAEELPKQYNTYRCLQIPPPQHNEAWVPPLYPPIKVGNDYFYYPCNKTEDIVPVMQFWGLKVTQPYLLDKTTWDKYEVDHNKFRQFQEHQWKKDPHAKIVDGMNVREGIDGWFYRKTAQNMGQYKTVYYQKLAQLNYMDWYTQ